MFCTMVIAKRWRELSIYIRFGLFCLIFSVILFLIAFSSVSWVSKTYEDKGTRIYGLWKTIRYYPWDQSFNEIKAKYDKEGLRIDSWETPLTITTRGKIKFVIGRIVLLVRYRPFNLKGGGHGFLFRSEFFFRTTQELEYFFFFVAQ